MKKRLKFDPETHTYTLNGDSIPSVTEICSTLNAYSGVSPALLMQAAQRGTQVHELTEMVDYGTPLEELPVTPEIAGYLQAYTRFKRDYSPEYILIEKAVFDDSLHYAGTLDRLAVIDGRETLIDFKTSSAATRRMKVSWACQLAAYANALEKPECRQWDVLLKKDGSYTIYPAEATAEAYDFMPFELFTTLLDINRILGGKK